MRDTLANCTRDAASTSCSFAQRARLEALALLGVSDVELLRFLSVAAALRPGGLICEPLLALLHGHHVHDARTIVLVRPCEAGGRIMGGGRARGVKWAHTHAGHHDLVQAVSTEHVFCGSLAALVVAAKLCRRVEGLRRRRHGAVWCEVGARCWRLSDAGRYLANAL